MGYFTRLGEMMEWYHYVMVGLGIVGLVLQGLVLAIGGTWKLAQMEARITRTIVKHRSELDAAIEIAKDHARDEADRVRQEFGETISAMQSKIFEFERWTRDTFVRRESFLLVTKDVKEAIHTQGDKTEKRLDRIDEKLDRIQQTKT